VFSHIPIIDVSPLVAGGVDLHGVATEIGCACRDTGFFYIVGHGVDEALQARLETLSREFFRKPAEEKWRIRMALAGRAWRGYFRVGSELTSGRPDEKEGIYFGEELPMDHPLVVAGTPLHGPNLFPAQPEGLRACVLEYAAALTTLGHRLMAAVALSLDLDEHYFAERCTGEPLTLFRIFNYPAPRDPEAWGVGEHTDYGLLTILKQDGTGGLEVKSGAEWVPAPPVANSFVCNIGDMLDRMTRGLYRSTPHRVRHPGPHDRLSFPFFFDPGFFSRVQPIDIPGRAAPTGEAATRWDRENVHAFEGTYGDYVLRKVSRVFPELQQDVLDAAALRRTPEA
jgi:isopenicillin N synthase-like dioxygenase